MKKQHLLKSMLLLCALVAGSESVWADETVTLDFATDQAYYSGGTKYTAKTTLSTKGDKFSCNDIEQLVNVVIEKQSVNSPGYYAKTKSDAASLRLYSSDILTISMADGASLIKQIDFTGTVSLSGVSDRKWTHATGLSSVEITGSGTNKLQKIVVTYTPSTVGGVISSSGWNTFSCSSPVDLSSISGGTAYYASEVSGSNVTLTPTTATVPAGEGLMIKGTAGNVFTINVAVSGTTISGNKLKAMPTGGSVAVSAGSTYNYVFGWPTDSPTDCGFYLVNSSVAKLGVRKAYLQTNEALSARLFIDFEDNDVTGVKAIENNKAQTNGEYFNLAGQRVAQPTKGLYIVNGKKVIIK